MDIQSRVMCLSAQLTDAGPSWQAHGFEREDLHFDQAEPFVESKNDIHAEHSAGTRPADAPEHVSASAVAASTSHVPTRMSWPFPFG
jgi:hypothetical protein